MKKVKAALFQTWEITLYVILVAVVCVNAYWYYEEDSYIFGTTPIPPQTINRGGIVSFERYACPRKADVKVEVMSQIRFEDGYLLRIGGYTHPPIKECGTIGVKKFIPYHIEAGNYEFVVTLEYQINPLKSMTKVLTPIEFTVIEEK